MVEPMEGVVKEAPVEREAPPEAAAYQSIVPAEAVAESVSAAVPQAEAGVVEVIDGMVFMVATTAVLGVAVHVPS